MQNNCTGKLGINAYQKNLTAKSFSGASLDRSQPHLLPRCLLFLITVNFVWIDLLILSVSSIQIKIADLILWLLVI